MTGRASRWRNSVKEKNLQDALGFESPTTFPGGAGEDRSVGGGGLFKKTLVVSVSPPGKRGLGFPRWGFQVTSNFPENNKLLNGEPGLS